MLQPCLRGAFLKEACLEELPMSNPVSSGNEQEIAHILVVHQGSEVISTNNNWTEKK